MNKRDKRLRKCRNNKREGDISSCKIKQNEVNKALHIAKLVYFKKLSKNYKKITSRTLEDLEIDLLCKTKTKWTC